MNVDLCAINPVINKQHLVTNDLLNVGAKSFKQIPTVSKNSPLENTLKTDSNLQSLTLSVHRLDCQRQENTVRKQRSPVVSVVFQNRLALTTIDERS